MDLCFHSLLGLVPCPRSQCPIAGTPQTYMNLVSAMASIVCSLQTAKHIMDTSCSRCFLLGWLCQSVQRISAVSLNLYLVMLGCFPAILGAEVQNLFGLLSGCSLNSVHTEGCIADLLRDRWCCTHEHHRLVPYNVFAPALPMAHTSVYP